MATLSNTEILKITTNVIGQIGCIGSTGHPGNPGMSMSEYRSMKINKILNKIVRKS